METNPQCVGDIFLFNLFHFVCRRIHLVRSHATALPTSRFDNDHSTTLQVIPTTPTTFYISTTPANQAQQLY